MNLTCDLCGVEFYKSPCRIRKHNFCSKNCSGIWTGKNLSEGNKVWNKKRMTPIVKAKLRKVNLGKGENKTYKKYHGRHEHRAVAEWMLGRPLGKNEIVHHKDGNIHNNSPHNLEIMTQSEHINIHRPSLKGGGAK